MKIGFQHNFEGSKQRAYIYQLNIFKLLEAGYDFENCYQKRKKNEM